MSLAYTFATGADLRLAEAAAHRRGLGDTAEPYRKTVKTEGGYREFRELRHNFAP